MNEEDYQKELQKQQFDIAKKAVMLRFMTKEARERLNRIRVVKPDVAEKVEVALIQALQMGQIKNMLTDEQLKAILQEISQKKDFNVKTGKK